MDMKSLPAELTLRQLAEILGLKLSTVKYRAQTGTIPTRKRSDRPKAHNVVPLDIVHRDFPELYHPDGTRTDRQLSLFTA